MNTIQSHTTFPEINFEPEKILHNYVFSPLAGVLLKDWLRLVKSSDYNITPRYWPRSVFTTIMAVGNSLLSKFEEHRYGEMIKREKVKKPIFIVGHHRSGTTHLWNLITTNPNFVYPKLTQTLFPSTFLSFQPIVKKMADVFAPDERPQDEIDLSESAPMSEEWAISASTFLSTHMIRHFPEQRQQFKKYLTMQDADTAEREFWKNRLDWFARKLLVQQQDDVTLLFKAPTHTAKIRLILELYPDARFINIHREPYRVFNSTLKMEQKAIPHCKYQKGDFDYLTNYIIWRYKTMYQAYFEDIEYLSPEQLVEISYEELDNFPVQTIQKIYKKLNITGFGKYHPRLERYVSSISNYQKNSYPELSKDLKNRLMEEWSPFYERLGYHPKEKKREFSNVF